MAIDSETRAEAGAGAQPAPVIENEIPNYRALSPWAVGSLVAGLLSILCFAHPLFLVAAALAVVLGGRAIAQLKRQRDLLTGEGLAKAGIVLGLACGLSSVTMTTVQTMLLNRRAEDFVRSSLLDPLKKGDVDAALWYRLEPTTRGSMSPEQVRKSFEGSKSPDPMLQMTEVGPVTRLAAALSKPQADLKLVRIEKIGWEGVTPVAVALLEVTGPEEAAPEGEDHAGHSDDHEESHRYAAVLIKNSRDGRREEWWVDRYIYPYKPDSYVAEMKPVDDGHGH